jgi:Domain of unknown function (DUF4262)
VGGPQHSANGRHVIQPLRVLAERLPPPLWSRLKKLEIRRRGWTSVQTADGGGSIAWAYTVGFEATLDHPELVIANRDHATTERLFGLVYRALRTDGLVIRDREPWDICGLPRAVWRKVDRSRITTAGFAMAMWHRRERGYDPNQLQVIQLVLPGFHGTLPWEPGYLEEERAHTAELWRPA